MTKQKILKQLKDIARLMESEIFHLIDDNQDLQYDYDGNETMLKGINEAIELVEETDTEEVDNLINEIKVKAIQNLINKEKTDVSKK